MDSGDRPSFGALLRRYRVAAGLSQEQLADRASLSTNAVSALERGTRQAPYRDTVRLLAGALGLSAGDQAALEATITRGRGTLATSVATGGAIKGLPTPPNPLVGREREIEEIGALLRGGTVRLLTLTGPGGVGKTRLALQVAEEVAGVFPDGVAFVALAPLRDATLVAEALAHALGVQERGDRTPLEGVHAQLRDAAMLLLLDNLEHLTEAMPLVSELLASARGLRVLATSRASLRLQGEQVYPVGPLATPDLDVLPSLDVLERVPSVALLVQRARAAMPSFALSTATARAVAALCHQLDGLPLAIELAAARLTVLSPQALSQRLEKRLPLLTGGPRDLPERQRTMRATLAWSYELLDEDERTLVRQLSVFAGGCRLDAAEALAIDHLGAREVVEEVIGALMEKSLLQRSLDADGEPRFTMLETVREYGIERLEEAGEAATSRRRHATYWREVAERAAPALIGGDQGRWLALLEEEHDNLRAALQWAREGGEEDRGERVETGLRLAAALWRFWYRRGHLHEGRRWCEDLVAASTGEDRFVAYALLGAAGLAWAQGAYGEAREMAERGLARNRAMGETAGVADALQMLGVIAAEQSDYVEAAARAEECLALRRELGDAWGSATALHNLGVVAQQRGEYARAEALYEECIALKRTLGDTAGVAVTLLNLGDVLVYREQYARGTALIEESLALHRGLGVREGVNAALHSLGSIARRAGDRARATALFEESLEMAREQGARAHEAYALVNLGDMALDRGAVAEAIGFYQDGLSLAEEISQHSATAYGLEGLAAVAQVRGRPEHAARLYGAAEALREEIDAPLAPVERADYGRRVGAVRAEMGAAATEMAWAAGRTQPLAKAVEDAREMVSDVELNR